MIEYDGGPFQGWQRQSEHQPSVQGCLEAAIARLHPGPHVVAGAGRTDAGVHATGQVAHADLPRAWDAARLTGAINAHLRQWPVAVLQAVEVAEDFHARFSARERRYLFRLLARRAEVEVLPAARAFGMGFFPWSPLGRGVLTGQYRAGTPRGWWNPSAMA